MKKFEIFRVTEFHGIRIPVIIVADQKGFVASVQFKNGFGENPRISGTRERPSDLSTVERQQITRSVNALLASGLINSPVNWVGVEPPHYYSGLDFRFFSDISQGDFESQIEELEPVTSAELEAKLSKGLVKLKQATKKLKQKEQATNSELEQERRQQQKTLRDVICGLIRDNRMADAIAYCQVFDRDIKEYLKGDGRFDLIVTPSKKAG